MRVHIERFFRDYHERTHSTTKQKPRERWEKNLTKHRTVTDLADLDHLLKSKEYTVQRYGIHFQNNYYRDANGVLGGFIGRRVTVFFDSRDTSEQSSSEVVTAENILPFIELDQYLDLVAMCDFVREYRYMGLLRGPAGAGKTVSAKRYRDEQPLMTANGQSPVLYFQLARGEENHKAFYAIEHK